MNENEDLEEFELAMDDAEIEESIPGIPSDEILTNLYIMGVLKYEYYIHAQSVRYGIDINEFNKVPELNLKELNGIKEEPPKDSKSK